MYSSSRASETQKIVGVGFEKPHQHRAHLALGSKINELTNTPNERADYEAAIDTYKNVKADPRSAIQNRTALLSELETAITDGDNAFTLLKASAINLMDIAPAFLTRFDAACGIIAPRTSTTKINFEVINGATQERIINYAVSSNALNLQNHMFMGDTLASKNHKSADVTISCEGFKSVTLNEERFKKGKNNTVRVVLMPMETAA